ncbi:plasmodesmata-located protein 7-like [Hibiscus syriacus]|uniref:plasmodesmata-located protein 7-like n=1 Tax=Hibiscus syriacus TaxID=106335 RepID=UPI001920B026|nr:plasmodesmata-located protein 7-like [Hibiscus syriacus]
MATSLLSLSFFLISFPFLPIQTILSSSTDAFVFGGCTQQKYTPDSPYKSNLNSLLTSLVNSATYSSYNNFTIMGSSPQDVVYGLYQCRGDLSMPDCATCVARAVSQTGSLCPSACGGAVQLQGCYVKYDNATFLGVEDKNVVTKKCGPSVEYEKESEIVGRRDAMMAVLEGGGGLLRVGGSGEVQGLAQCVGDLSLAECQDCLSAAIQRLKAECGAGAYGDMYLGKCYATFTTSDSRGDDHYYPKSHNDKSRMDGEKTFAIIIGLLAGIALLIIFLAFLRKVVDRNGK